MDFPRMVGAGSRQALSRLQRPRALEASREPRLTFLPLAGEHPQSGRWLVWLGVLLLAGPLAAQTPDSLAADSLRIRAVEIKTFNIYRPNETKNVLFRVINGIHVVTRPSIVRR